jgi:hypothetical protein
MQTILPTADARESAAPGAAHVIGARSASVALVGLSGRCCSAFIRWFAPTLDWR